MKVIIVDMNQAGKRLSGEYQFVATSHEAATQKLKELGIHVDGTLLEDGQYGPAGSGAWFLEVEQV